MTGAVSEKDARLTDNVFSTLKKTHREKQRNCQRVLDTNVFLLCKITVGKIEVDRIEEIEKLLTMDVEGIKKVLKQKAESFSEQEETL